MSELLSKIQGIAEGKDLSALGSSIKFVVDEEVVLIDPETGTITSDDNDASCTVTVDGETMEEILNGSTSSQAAFMTGKLKVAGDMGVALKVGTILSQNQGLQLSWLEQRTHNPSVAGSSPAGPTT